MIVSLPRTFRHAPLLGLLLLAGPALAQTDAPLQCPSLKTAQRVGDCPSEAELKFTFTGYCSDNARIYGKDSTCTDYQAYRRLKNVALWESADGAFQGYVSCALDETKLRAALPRNVAITRQGKLTRVLCTYDEGVALALRTRDQCTLAGGASEGRCDGAADNCKVSCAAPTE